MKSTLSEAPYSSNSHLLEDVLALSDVNHYAARFDWNSTGDLELIRLETQGGLQGETPPQKDSKELHRRKTVTSLSIKEELGVGGTKLARLDSQHLGHFADSVC